jgi:RHS repeat-associated protein
LNHDVFGTAQDLTLGFTYTLASELQQRVSSNSLYTWIPAAATKTYVPDALNRYSSVNGTSFTYDGRGNLTSDGSRTFTYDVENHLLTEVGGAGLTLSYDPLGRLWQSVSGATTTQFLYAGDNLIGEYPSSGPVLRRYVHGPGTDEPIVWYEGSTLTDRRWLHADERGSIIAKTDGTGSATAYTYGPYGESTWAGPRFAYTGQIALPEAQLYHYKARVYDPSLGRFLQTDPVGTKDDFNLYAYVHGDPINGSDPSGLADDTFSNDSGGCGSHVGGTSASCTSVSLSGTPSDAGGKKSSVAVNIGAPAVPVTVQMPSNQAGAFEQGVQDAKTAGLETATGGELKAGATLLAGLKVLFRFGAKDIAKASAKELLRDSTGKVHGTLPNAADLKNASPDLIRHNVDELRGSVLARQQELERLGGTCITSRKNRRRRVPLALSGEAAGRYVWCEE